MIREASTVMGPAEHRRFGSRSAARLLVRFAAYGAAGFGVVGGVVGLVIGLSAYPPTAWFAVLEIGLPCAVIGGAIGAMSGALALGIRTVWTDRHLDR
jgi:hypothetical protein